MFFNYFCLQYFLIILVQNNFEKFAMRLIENVEKLTENQCDNFEKLLNSLPIQSFSTLWHWSQLEINYFDDKYNNESQSTDIEMSFPIEESKLQTQPVAIGSSNIVDDTMSINNNTDLLQATLENTTEIEIDEPNTNSDNYDLLTVYNNSDDTEPTRFWQPQEDNIIKLVYNEVYEFDYCIGLITKSEIGKGLKQRLRLSGYKRSISAILNRMALLSYVNFFTCELHFLCYK